MPLMILTMVVFVTVTLVVFAFGAAVVMPSSVLGARLRASVLGARLRASVLGSHLRASVLGARLRAPGVQATQAPEMPALILFETNQFSLKPAARESLAKLAGILLACPDLRLEVYGHTDSVGSDAYNQLLSEKRAAAVREYLVQQGLPVSSVAVMGFGKTQPVASNATAAGRQRNRRVEFVVSTSGV